MAFSSFLKYWALILVTAIITFVILLLELPDKNFQIHFFDVGQGDAIFIKTPENHQVLIDGGKNDQILERLSEVMPFFDKEIDLVILTHPDLDHLGGLIEAIHRYKFNMVLITGIALDDDYYSEFLDEIGKQNGSVIFANQDSDFLLGDVQIDVLFPFEKLVGESFANTNLSSIVSKISYFDHEILLTGDMEKEIESLLISKNNLSAEILKIGHHGSKTSSSEEFLKQVSPEYAVIQCGKNNSYGHPHEETLEAIRNAGIKKILRTDQLKTIEFIF